MWEYEYSVEARVTPEAVWRVWSDVDGSASWNAGVEFVELRGPFAAGTEFTLKAPGRDAVTVRLAEVVEYKQFVEETEANGLVTRIYHQIEELDPGITRLTYRVEITGPEADELGPQLGPGLAEAFPELVTRLVEAARG